MTSNSYYYNRSSFTSTFFGNRTRRNGPAAPSRAARRTSSSSSRRSRGFRGLAAGGTPPAGCLLGWAARKETTCWGKHPKYDMAIVTLYEGNFEGSVSGDGIVMVDCWARWCEACKTFRPVYEKVAAKYPEITFGSLNTGVEKSLVSKLGIEHIPTLLLYRDGILLFQQPGYYGEEEMEGILQQAETLDMDLVRSEIVADRKKPVVKTATYKDNHNDGEKVRRAHDQFEMDQGKVGDDLFVSRRGS